MMARFTAALCVIMGMLFGGPAGATEDLLIDAFAGYYVGTGVAKEENTGRVDLTERRLKVSIATEDDGFALSWSTALRQDDGSDDSGFTENARALLFEPTDRADVFQGAVELDPLAGWPFVWARISGHTLTVHSLLVHDDGSYEIQTYDRTLGATGMELYFTRVRDGKLVRSVTGKLVKVGG